MEAHFNRGNVQADTPLQRKHPSEIADVYAPLISLCLSVMRFCRDLSKDRRTTQSTTCERPTERSLRCTAGDSCTNSNCLLSSISSSSKSQIFLPVDPPGLLLRNKAIGNYYTFGKLKLSIF